MKLSDLFESDDGDTTADLPWLVIEIPAVELCRARLLLYEGQWRPSEISGIWYRVDPARPEMKQQRHVHVASQKHIKAPTKQASWNTDTTKHDRSTFNDKLGNQGSYQAVAKSALGLSSDTILEHLTNASFGNTVLLTESVDPSITIERYRWMKTPRRDSILKEIIDRHVGDIS